MRAADLVERGSSRANAQMRTVSRPRTLAESKGLSPRYAVNWRYSRACRLATLPRLRKVAIDDWITFRAAKYVRLANRILPKSQEVRERSLRNLDEEIFVASCIAMLPEYQPVKRALMLRILAGQDDATICSGVELRPPEVGIFHDLFFSVRPQLPAPDAIMARIRGKTVGLGLDGLDVRKLQAYYAFTLGREFVELVLCAGEPDAPDVNEFARQMWRDFASKPELDFSHAPESSTQADDQPTTSRQVA